MERGKDMAAWYHGSNLRLTVLRAGSTVTKNKALAEAFSHRPSVLCMEDSGEIVHNGREAGFLYCVDEPAEEGRDVYQHPRSSVEAGVEFLTARPLRLRLIGGVPPPTEAEAWAAERAIEERLRAQNKP